MSNANMTCRICHTGTLENVTARVHSPMTVGFGFAWLAVAGLSLAVGLVILFGTLAVAANTPRDPYRASRVVNSAAMYSCIGPFILCLICGTIGSFCIASKEILRCQTCEASVEICSATRYIPPSESLSPTPEDLERGLQEVIKEELRGQQTKPS